MGPSISKNTSISDGSAFKTTGMDGCRKSGFLFLWVSVWINDLVW